MSAIPITCIDNTFSVIDVLKGTKNFYVSNPWFKRSEIKCPDVKQFLTATPTSNGNGMLVTVPRIYVRASTSDTFGFNNTLYLGDSIKNATEFSVMSPYDQSIVKKNMNVGVSFNQPWAEDLVRYDYRFTMVFDILLMAKAFKIDMSKYDKCDTNEAFFKKFNEDILAAQQAAPANVSEKLKKKGFVQATEHYISMWDVAPVTVKEDENVYMISGVEWEKDKDTVVDKLSEFHINWLYKQIAPFMKSVMPAYDIKTSNFKTGCSRLAYVPKNQTEYKVINKFNFRFGIDVKETDKSGNEVLMTNKMATKFVVGRGLVNGDIDKLKSMWGGAESKMQQNKGKILLRLGYCGAVFKMSVKTFEFSVDTIHFKANNKPKVEVDKAIFEMSDDEDNEASAAGGSIDVGVLEELVDEE